MHILDDLAWRGLIQDSTGIDALREHIDAGQVTFYIGFDPTAPSLHVGHLMQLITARRLQQAGLRPLLLVGGATGQIGDPREVGERIMNPPEVVAGWVEKLRAQVAPFVTYDGENGAVPVNNLDWTSEMGVVEFLRDVGKHFPVSKMLARDVVKSRLESGISFTEFSYQLLQSNDFYELNRRHGCTLQFGGSDQWGNITAGVDFIRRRSGAHVHAFVSPLVTKADGTKFGKSEGGAVWLDAELTSPYAFYQFWVNSGDADVVRYLKCFSLKSHEEIEELERATAEKPAARLAQKALAEELTTLLHGAEETAHVVAASQALFGRGELAELPESTLRAALVEAGLAEFTKPDVTVAEAMKESGVVASLGEARRAAKEGGAYLNNVRVSDPAAVIDPSDLLHGRYGVIRRGKKTVAGFEVVG
ncbi:tyrosine--tRNA ligase [Glycomyces algeriensis]|uniref:Tyrosine--tRNA ligase n=1 Tax=Glycomyces algeriensis TaxID=256037 RepID=A0A9W6G9M9_9ACTN|nr:tyrosine--tRNA ligase [Glycomyces algeriensis]MDA1364188.1 tyrosine--tRNA ligase [Glycomyces algeriensis]MDR7350213.1 tyrosyl-tRNA synthetase [Glycomyces algeriensis]GLI42925.1 tyrosine--tRNA ligase [Glycomyces algeriensis]